MIDWTQIIIALISLIGGGLGWNIISTKLMPKKEQKEADKAFIDTLLQRVAHLEGRMDEQSKQLTTVMTENAMLKVELDYLRKENQELKEELSKND